MNLIFKSIPVFLFLAICVFPLVLYTISASTGHVNLFFPYVSDLGIIPPEASLFTFFMCFGGCVMFMFVIFRHDLYQSYLQNSKIVRPKRNNVDENKNEDFVNNEENCKHLAYLSKNSFATGTVVWFGFILIGSFRNNEILGVQIVHSFSAALTFTAAVVDIFIEMFVAKRLGMGRISFYRLIILVLCSIFGLIHGITGALSFLKYEKSFTDKNARLFWKNTDPAFVLHVTSSITEWFFIYLIGVYFLTYHEMFMNAQYINKAGNKISCKNQTIASSSEQVLETRPECDV